MTVTNTFNAFVGELRRHKFAAPVFLIALLGMIILPPGYTDAAMLEAGSPYGGSAIVGAENRPPRPEDLDAMRHQSRRTVAIAGALIAAGEMPCRKIESEA